MVEKTEVGAQSHQTVKQERYFHEKGNRFPIILKKGLHERKNMQVNSSKSNRILPVKENGLLGSLSGRPKFGRSACWCKPVLRIMDNRLLFQKTIVFIPSIYKPNY